jgi:hypothetical protein
MGCVVKQRKVNEAAADDILKIEETQEALRESIEQTKRLSERADTLLQQCKQTPPRQK